ncbi:hypothetical protein SCATT_35310 [Streptantibioticus cattleyicolor NRRL 8057 = DSM 46488]|uniref:Uncharacterized protein n=1 Tax=Streptantibioticus cattleyicolor (strain ATCC 35852 / DSM 46488 / JCM 4925 / NBRC 14057 / NRRL 8057) TaxID=1003195 RepID=G8WUL2_STREN|nr:hypothetical protein SCATT_35310 [Streptantibioticus cattleyicolor NRRL 8057 = DSM 46488]
MTGTCVGGAVLLSMTDQEREDLSEKVKDANRRSENDAAARGGR